MRMNKLFHANKIPVSLSVLAPTKTWPPHLNRGGRITGKQKFVGNILDIARCVCEARFYTIHNHNWLLVCSLIHDVLNITVCSCCMLGSSVIKPTSTVCLEVVQDSSECTAHQFRSVTPHFHTLGGLPLFRVYARNILYDGHRRAHTKIASNKYIYCEHTYSLYEICINAWNPAVGFQRPRKYLANCRSAARRGVGLGRQSVWVKMNMWNLYHERVISGRRCCMTHEMAGLAGNCQHIRLRFVCLARANAHISHIWRRSAFIPTVCDYILWSVRPHRR